MTEIAPGEMAEIRSAEAHASGRSTVKASALRAVGISKSFQGGRVPAVDRVSLTVDAGEFVSLVGPSGCGKSTLFNILAGLVRPDEGHVMLGDEDVTAQPGHVGYMPQQDLLLPWRTVLDNAVLGLDIRGVSRKTSYAEARLLLGQFGLLEHQRQYPAALSGGMRQRCAMIRTVLYGSRILLLDEPLSALDAQTRLLMQEWLLEVWNSLGLSVFYITHDLEEALFLSDRVYVMSARPGRILEEVGVDLPRPRTSEVRTAAQFVALKARIMDIVRAQARIALASEEAQERPA
jgi:ABC-type nitrate/sulfonate/bicarbonate transport system ATPase subunit